MLEAFNELMADPASRAELVGGVVEALIFVIPAGAYILSLRTSSCRFELEAEAIDMAVELDHYREFLAILSSEIEDLRQQIDEAG